MKHFDLWAPWRIDYILGEKDGGCIFCKKPLEDNDKKNLILYRSNHAFLIFNKYPYNSGHLMAVPYRHVKNFEDLSDDESLDLNFLIKLALRILKKNMAPEGFNVGLNIGKAGGAGIDEHLHYHIVPRWSGDTNFMPVFSDTRVIPQLLSDTYEVLQKDIHEFKK